MLRQKCLLKQVIEEKVEETGIRGRRRKQVLDDLKGTTGYGKVKETLDRTICRTLLGRVYGRAVRQTT